MLVYTEWITRQLTTSTIVPVCMPFSWCGPICPLVIIGGGHRAASMGLARIASVTSQRCQIAQLQPRSSTLHDMKTSAHYKRAIAQHRGSHGGWLWCSHSTPMTFHSRPEGGKPTMFQAQTPKLPAERPRALSASCSSTGSWHPST
jgi:hypothetical protein